MADLQCLPENKKPGLGSKPHPIIVAKPSPDLLDALIENLEGLF